LTLPLKPEAPEGSTPAKASLLQRLQRSWIDWIDRPRSLLLPVLVVNAVLSLYTAVVTLRIFPNASDEYSYLVQAQLFASGNLSVPSPQKPEFFDFDNIVNNGRFFSKYPPGWPLLLSVGAALGAPWIVNSLIGAVTLGLLHLTARKHFSVQAANLVLLMLTCSPFFVFNSASYFSHPSCLLSIALAYYFYFNEMEGPASPLQAALFGASAGLAFLIRPFTMVALTVPLWIHLGIRTWTTRRWPENVRVALSACGAVLAFLGIFILYNYLQTGDPLLQPFTLYDSHDKPRIPVTIETLGEWLYRFVVLRLWELNCDWMPFCLPLLGLCLARRVLREDAKVRLLLCSVGTLVISFSLYPTDGGNRYGPRYIYEALGAIAILCAFSMKEVPRLSLPLTLGVLVMNVITFVGQTHVLSEVVRQKMQPYHLAEERKLSHAIVFLKTGSGEAAAGDLTRNGIGFNCPVLYVRNLGDKNWSLVEDLDRDPYVFEYQPHLRRGLLLPLRR
jgi:4-amino-4-deoxy-L-arabinose transferase-like glycosyltransferase